MIQCWRTWKVQNQVLSIFLIQSFTLVIILLTIDAVQLPHIDQLFLENSKMLMVRQNNLSTTFTQSLIVKNISVILNRSLRQIVNANYLFQHSIGLDYQYIQQPLDCIDNTASRDQYIYKSSVCYGHFGLQSQNNIQDQQFFNYTALTTSLLPIYDAFTIFYTQSMKDDQYFTQYPGRDLTGQNPRQRAWYKKYIEKNDTSLTTICTPFLSNTNSYMIAQSTGLKYLNGTIFGVIGNPLQVLNILRTAYQNINISIVDKTGLIYSVGQQNATQIYLYNKSYTGFDEEQQTQILSTLNKESIMLFNTNLFKNVTITARSLGRTGLILVFQSDPLFQEDIIKQHLMETSEKRISLFFKVILSWIGITLFCIIVSVIALLLILKPITDITKIIRKAISPISKQQALELYLQNKNHSQLSSFQDAFHKLITSISQGNLNVNHQCKLMNNVPCYKSIGQTDYLRQPLIEYLTFINDYFPQDYQFAHPDKESFYSQINRAIYTIQ